MITLDELIAMFGKGTADSPSGTGVWIVPDHLGPTLAMIKGPEELGYVVEIPNDGPYQLFGRPILIVMSSHSLKTIQFKPFCSRCGRHLRIDRADLCMNCGWRAIDD